jgi:hypothetical protein
VQPLGGLILLKDKIPRERGTPNQVL